ncbi:MAG: hypothetical protein FJ404_08055 [Verrucomicrobia bacterium]|nr:hypothetical protein [Verrucomicrobiota bacterium]
MISRLSLGARERVPRKHLSRLPPNPGPIRLSLPRQRPSNPPRACRIQPLCGLPSRCRRSPSAPDPRRLPRLPSRLLCLRPSRCLPQRQLPFPRQLLHRQHR